MQLEPDGLEGFFTYRLHLLSKLTDKLTAERFSHELGLSLSDARCLAALGHFGAMSVVALAAKANLDKSQASRAADALVAQGLLAKLPDRLDNRGLVLKLTRAGSALARKVLRVAKERNEVAFASLNTSERQVLGDWLNRLIAQAREQAA